MSLLWTIAVTDQKVRLLHAGAGFSWVEEWRAGELTACCYAIDLHPERFVSERNSTRHQCSSPPGMDGEDLIASRFFG